MKRFLVPVAALAVVSVFAQQTTPNTPEDSVKKFLECFNAKDLKGSGAYVVGAKSGTDYKVVLDRLGKTWPTLKLTKFEAKVDGSSAHATYSIEILAPANQGAPTQKVDSEADLKLEGKVWKIVPTKRGAGKFDIVGNISEIVVNPGLLSPTSEAALTTVSLSNVKQLALACLMLAGDNDDVLKIDPSNARKALAPYLKNDQLWFYPGDKSGIPAYCFNANLAKADMTRIKDFAKVVMVYQGSKGKLKFMNGKAAVGFADGHAKNITPEQEKTLIWKP